MAEKSESDLLIEKEEKSFLKRLGRELERLLNEGIEFTLSSSISEAHHAIYRDFNQTVATKLRIGVYTFDTRGRKYPDRTMCSLPVDVQQIRDRLLVKTSILNPIYIDN